MTGTELLLTILAAVALGEAYYIWLKARQRPAWWHTSTPEVERLIRELFAGQTHQVSNVVLGLHQDLDGLRQEIRAMAHLPPETQIPDVVRELHAVRLMLVAGICSFVVLGGAVAFLLLEHAQRVAGY